MSWQLGKIPRIKFWADEQDWPREPEGLIFLARAMQEAAPVVLGGNYRGDEFTAERIPDLPLSPILAHPDQLTLAENLLDHFRPEWRSAAETAGASPAPPKNSLKALGQGLGLLGRPYFSDDDWDFARQRIRQAQSERSARLQRRGEVAEWFSRCIHDRRSIAMFVARIGGGPVLNAAPGFWNAKLSELDHIFGLLPVSWTPRLGVS